MSQPREDRIRVITVSDDRYIIPLGVMLTSLLHNASAPARVEISVIDGGLSPENKEKVRALAGKYHAAIRFLPIRTEEFRVLKTTDVLKSVVYFRLAIPDLMEASVDRVLYLDCDILVEGDIAELWETDIKGKYLGAVADFCIEAKKVYRDTKDRLGIPAGYQVFNSGVMLMDLSLWRRDNVHRKILDFIARNPEKILLADQDGLNAILHDKWFPLPARWNLQTFLSRTARGHGDSGIPEATGHPGIVHFTGIAKPWHYSDLHPEKKEFFRYFAMTGWEICEVSVILPALDEEQTIASCITKIQQVFSQNRIRGEIIVADASSDRTPDIARSLGAIVIRPEKGGYGNAYLAAFAHARGQCLVIGDADDTYDFREIPLLLAPLKEGADLVIGSRFAGSIHPGSMTPLHRYLGNPLLTGMVNLIFGTRFSDTHSGFRAIAREAWDRLDVRTGGMEFASEMLIMASKNNLRIREVPINYYPRKTPSKLHSFADGWRHIRFVLLMKPLPFIAVPGFLFSVVGFLLMAFFFLQGNVEENHLHTFILGAIMIMGGTQVVFSALLMKTYSVIHGYERKAGIIELFMRYHNLEWFLLCGALLAFTGILAGLNILIRWIRADFGFLSQISTAIIALVLVVTGLQIFLFSIFQSMMLLNENSASG